MPDSISLVAVKFPTATCGVSSCLLDRLFVKSEQRSLLRKHIRVVDVDAHINDEECARVAMEELQI
jgi:hypothetical protein